MKAQGCFRQKTLRRILIGLSLAAAAGAPAVGAVGDVVDQIDVSVLPNPGFPNFCSIGLAFDGTHLYYDRCFDPLVYTVAPPAPGVPGPIYDLCIPELPNAMAYDGTGNGAIWIGTQGGVGAGVSLCGSVGMPIYKWDFGVDGTPGNADDTVGGCFPFMAGCGGGGCPPTPEFVIPLGSIAPLDGGPPQDLTGFCFCDGLAFDATAPLTTGAGPGLWWSDDVNPNVGLFDLTGTLHNAYTATTVDPGLGPTSGLVAGGPLLYLGNNGGGQVFRTNKLGDPLPAGAGFAALDDRVEDLECDPVTYATDVIWVRSTPQANPADDLMTAYEIEPDTCGLGGEPECDPDPRSQGYWHRQCMGAGLIVPGRDDHGGGPDEPLEPNFDPDLIDCAFERLESVLYGVPTCEAMDADPPNNPCEKAEKQLTALILNVCSGKLSNSCEVDVSAESCTSTTIGELISEVANLIIGAECQKAIGCAGHANEGFGEGIEGEDGGSLADDFDATSDTRDQDVERPRLRSPRLRR